MILLLHLAARSIAIFTTTRNHTPMMTYCRRAKYMLHRYVQQRKTCSGNDPERPAEDALPIADHLQHATIPNERRREDGVGYTVSCGNTDDL